MTRPFQGISCHDLGIADRHDLSETVVRSVWEFVQTLCDPDLGIADEVVDSPIWIVDSVPVTGPTPIEWAATDRSPKPRASL